ncbi:MAG: hypothetical protein AAGM67_10445, partial [Bacteroidota bacterium]
MKLLAYSSRWGFSIPIALRKFKGMVPAFIFLCSAFIITPLTAQISLSATASADPVSIGDNFTLDIDIATGTQDVNTVGIELSYNPTVFEITGSNIGATLPVGVGPNIDDVNGTITFAGSILSPGASANGTFNVISFDIEVIGGSGQEAITFVSGTNTQVALGPTVFSFTTNDLSITVNNPNANTTPVINSIGNFSVDEGGNIQIPLSITDADGDNLTVSISSLSNEPPELQSTNVGAQTDPYPFDATAFFAENNIVSTNGSYSSSLDFSPTFGDGGSNGDGNGVYTITIQVDDEDGNTV